MNRSGRNKREGIVVAGGAGNRLYPITKVVSKLKIACVEEIVYRMGSAAGVEGKNVAAISK